jgi:GT2 family glycosyltransferase
MIRLPSAANPEVSIVVLLDGAAEMGERCLRAIADGDDSVPTETILLLNDPDPPLESLARSTSGAKLVTSRANAGPGVGWNLGAAVAAAPRVASLHEDSEPSPGWLAPLVETMNETGAGAVGSRLFNHDGTIQNCGWVLFSDGSHQHINSMSAPETAASSEPTPADFLSGAAMLVDLKAADTFGRWDERFQPAVYGDIDITTAMWSRGRLVLSVPSSEVRHMSGSFDTRPNSPLTGPRLRLYLYERHCRRFLDKWGTALGNRAAPPPNLEPESIRLAVEAALVHTEARAISVRDGEWKPADSEPMAEHTFTGIAEPVVEEADGSYTVAPQLVDALIEAEHETVSGYCSWLIEREADFFERLREAGDHIENLRTYATDLESEHGKAVARLEEIQGSRAWRLRNFVLRARRKARSTFSRDVNRAAS